MAGISVSLPADLNYELDKLAYDSRKAKSEVVQDALRFYFKQNERKNKNIKKSA